VSSLRLVWTVLSVIPSLLSGAEQAGHFPAMFADPAIFERSLVQEPKLPAPVKSLTGITVPHHLLAVDLIARAFRLAEGGRYDRVILLSPDHFLQSEQPFATSRRGFQTPFGIVGADDKAIARLLASDLPIEESELFRTEHGVHAVLPFVAKLFQGARLLPVAISIASQPSDWDRLAAALKPLVTPTTLVVQSTDFSHYLPRREARLRDQETLNAIASGRPEAVMLLRQPAHLDSKGAQYVHMKLQKTVYDAVPEVIENKNSFDYLQWEESPTTSYIVQVFRRPGLEMSPLPVPGRQQIWYFAGDTNFGRYMTRPLEHSAQAKKLKQRILAFTGGAPLVVNLEGVMLDRPLPTNLNPLQIAMASDTALRWLQDLNVKAVSLANNHSGDFGIKARDEMQARLRGSGIEALSHGETHDFGLFRLIALSDVDNRGEQRSALISETELDRLQSKRLPQPVLTFLHWGTEYEAVPGNRETELMTSLRHRGFSLVVGAHPHVASSEVFSSPRGTFVGIYSLGNFLFDQLDRRTTGTLAEIRFFAQQTYFIRSRPIGNLYRTLHVSAKAKPQVRNLRHHE
jgi:AmmeMemoRadiSam system protein B